MSAQAPTEPPSQPIEVVGRGASKAHQCNPQLLEIHWGTERMWQHSCVTLMATIDAISVLDLVENGFSFA